jgi:rSAM/selenodomain-associated transferase 1
LSKAPAGLHSTDSALIVFSKVPRRGYVKTRLAARIGGKRALSCVATLLERCLSVASKVTAGRYLYLAPADWREEEIAPFSRLLRFFELRPQSGPTLGERMAAAVSYAFLTGCRKAVIIGSDIPLIKGDDVEEAFAALESADLVLGPSDDGGYWLLGLRAGLDSWKALFSGIPWGGNQVLEETVGRAGALGLRVCMLRRLFDVDTEEDVKRWLVMEKDPIFKTRIQALFAQHDD